VLTPRSGCRHEANRRLNSGVLAYIGEKNPRGPDQGPFRHIRKCSSPKASARRSTLPGLPQAEVESEFKHDGRQCR